MRVKTATLYFIQIQKSLQTQLRDRRKEKKTYLKARKSVLCHRERKKKSISARRFSSFFIKSSECYENSKNSNKSDFNSITTNVIVKKPLLLLLSILFKEKIKKNIKKIKCHPTKI